jgi:RNA polymerase sigma-70 factor (ECF subfamily)
LDLLVDDRRLLSEFRKGDRSALERVYRHYAPEIALRLRSGFMLNRQGQPPTHVGLRQSLELESALQEVFFRAFKEPARLGYDGLRPYRDYLLGITRYVVCDELRRRLRTREVSADDLQPSEQLVDPGAGPDQRIEEREAIDVVRSFLDQGCDDRDRRLYTLRYQEGLSQDAAAHSAGLTRTQVRRWEAKFRARLLKHLKRVRYV